jgi:Zn-dependent alcohol dehydrogenase
VPRLLEMRAAGRVDVDDLGTTYPIEQIKPAIAAVTNGDVVKPVLGW